ncbi:DEAD/DEAH box helicase family protein [Fulvivirgaceae bacterium PWU5]|uniref:DEAD/DEAH box helicase family protein n=1 Tax=Dawidia cretensis TaxID=2782350 RepID=A0AAP2E3C6_9BACT|nr:DEAD/DEAH box helicase family protein [Dawidia cretensis]MBT1712311.1 DEAD/DEAH box helicase family protein [Dawidia cretensis]
MLNSINWAEDRTYRSETENEPYQFYSECLVASTKLDLLLGYFSSSAINVLSHGFATFLYNGGSVRMVINNILSEADKQAIKKGHQGSIPNLEVDLNDIKKLRRTLDEYGIHFFECLSWLIANDKIQIKIIRPKDGTGIAHYKSGIFSDSNNSVGFNASCNFTAFGLLENLEKLTCHLSWDDRRSQRWIEKETEYFENIFNGTAEFAEYLDVDSVTVAMKNEFGSRDIQELLVKEAELHERKVSKLRKPKIRESHERVLTRIEELSREPKFPYPQGPREYQRQAHASWVANGYKGLFAMATGTGKTLTSLNCLLNEFYRIGSYKAIILVPTIALLNQWKDECLKFNFRNIITVSSRGDWSGKLSFNATASNFISTSFIVIVTYASFYRKKFQAHFVTLPEDTLLIADEVHNIGSPNVARILPKIHLQKRIGLSATPNRKYDEEGNLSIERFFNDRPPFVFSYSMRQAMENDPPALCQYKYYPHLVRLSDEELEEYLRISKQLLKYFDAASKKFKDNPEVENLLLMRKRVIHKAEQKLPVFRKILQDEFRLRKNLKYTLVYVPEGLEANYEEVDEIIEDDEEIRLINEYTRAVSRVDQSVMVSQYTAATKDRQKLTEDYEQGKVHVLTSMKCLDEGVDVPRSELAIFCASTGNPRQFVQRRGRVLRLHKDKIFAVIHDLVVVPATNDDESTFEMEKNLVKAELERVIDFSSLSMNSMDTYQELRPVLEYYNLNLYEDTQVNS